MCYLILIRRMSMKFLEMSNFFSYVVANDEDVKFNWELPPAIIKWRIQVWLIQVSLCTYCNTLFLFHRFDRK